MIDPTAAAQLSPGVSLVVVFLTLSILFAGFAWALIWRSAQRKRAAEALASVTSAALPARGPVVLHGTVETEDPERPAITFTLVERGEEQENKSSWSHTWTEIHREVRAEPFYLKLASGTLVHVEPRDDVFLVDALRDIDKKNPRTRCAELTHGEKAFVSGVLGSGWHPRIDASEIDRGQARGGSAYRGGPSTGLVLRSGKERMLVSTEPLGARYERQAGAHRLFAIVFGVALALSTTLLYGSTLAVHFFGKVVETDLVYVRHWSTSGKGGPVQHYAARGRYVDAAGRTVEVEDEVNRGVYDAFATKTLPRLPFVVAFDRAALSNVGERPTVGIARGFVPLFGAILLVVFYVGAVRGAREWYDQRLVVTRGAGRL